jgi:hypothetical protein
VRSPPPLAARIGAVEFAEFGRLVAVRCPRAALSLNLLIGIEAPAASSSLAVIIRARGLPFGVCGGPSGRSFQTSSAGAATPREFAPATRPRVLAFWRGFWRPHSVVATPLPAPVVVSIRAKPPCSLNVLEQTRDSLIWLD